MAEISPFRGALFDPAAAGDLSAVICPPYDVIAPAERDALEAAGPYNCVRLVLPRDEPGDEPTSKYTRARALLDSWLAAGVLRHEDHDALYVYELHEPVGAASRVQRGLVAAVALEGDGALPHERTYGPVVDDRLALLRATAANLDPVFLLYEGPGGPSPVTTAATGAPTIRARGNDGVEHLVWRVSDPRAQQGIATALAGARLYIADGHHRWQTARLYRRERRAEGPGPWDRQLAFVADASHEGPRLRAIHRVLAGVDPDDAIARLAGPFDVEEASDAGPDALCAELERRRGLARTYAATDGKRAWWLTLADETAATRALPDGRSDAWRDLDVAVLHAFAFERLLDGVDPGFTHSASEAVAAVHEGGASLAILLAPPSFAAVRAVADAGEAMPQKSTSFVPKPATGLVIRPLA